MTSKNFDDLLWLVTDNPEVGETLGLERNSLVLLKTFDEGRNDFTGSFNSNELSEFVNENRFSTVMTWNEASATRI
jgi:protein disulfide-isomerase A1